MGRYYALNDNEPSDVADAAQEHYRPVGPSDAVPTGKVSIAVALADKLDQLVAFFAYDEKPTGSGDPFALRRAALGVIRIILSNKVPLPIMPILDHAQKQFDYPTDIQVSWGGSNHNITCVDVLNFLADRLKVALREKGTRHDLIDAVFSLGNEDDLVRLVARVEALQAFLKTDDGANLLAGYKRAANILRAEEKKDGKPFIGEVSESHLAEPQEKALYTTLSHAQSEITPALEREDFAGAMRVMAGLRAPVDAFFDKVKVNADDPVIRNNRLNLLAALRQTLLQVADFSKIDG
jgi:glycyl-tRNA synthetase beta chain